MGGALLAVSMVLGCIVGEGLLRVFWPQELGTWIYTRDRITTHFPNMTQYSYTFGHDIVTNSAGMRDREHKIIKSEGQFRILVLGDSFMEAYQVRFEDSFVSILERQLRSAGGRDVEVINASVSGWGTDDELTYLLREGLKYKPDLILVAMTIHNDVSDNLVEEYHTFREGQLQQKPVSLVPWASYAILKIKEWFNANSHLYRLVFQATQTRWISEQGKVLESHVGGLLRKVPDDRVQTGWNMTGQLFKKLVVTAQSIDAKIVVVLLPLSVQVYPESLEDFLKWNGLRREDVDLLKPQKTMAAFGKELGFTVIDLLPAFQSTKDRCACELFVRNDGHWNETGHRISSELVVSQLVELGMASAQGR